MMERSRIRLQPLHCHLMTPGKLFTHTHTCLPLSPKQHNLVLSTWWRCFSAEEVTIWKYRQLLDYDEVTYRTYWRVDWGISSGSNACIRYGSTFVFYAFLFFLLRLDLRLQLILQCTVCDEFSSDGWYMYCYHGVHFLSHCIRVYWSLSAVYHMLYFKRTLIMQMM